MSDDDEIGPDRSEHTSHRAALSAALAETPHLTRDVALVYLARSLADRLDWVDDQLSELDEHESYKAVITLETIRDKVVMRYLAVLEKMGMAPGSRSERQGGVAIGPPDPSAVALERLTRGAAAGAAAAGVDYAAAVDPTVAATLTSD